MKEPIKIMNKELFGLCAYRILVIARRVFLASMILFFSYGIYYHVYSRPIIYLSLASLFLPAAISALFSVRLKEENKPKEFPGFSTSVLSEKKKSPQFPTLWKRYQYTPDKLRNLGIGSLIEVVLLLLWQFTSAVSFPSRFFTWLPCILSGFLIVFFLFGTPVLFFIFKRKLMYGKL